MAEDQQPTPGAGPKRSLGVYLGVAVMLFVVLLVYAAGQLLTALGGR
jgi:hypothetical protein